MARRRSMCGGLILCGPGRRRTGLRTDLTPGSGGPVYSP